MTSFISQSSGRPKVKAQRHTPSTIVYWLRFGVAILAALLCYGLQLKGSSGVTLAAFLYLLTIMSVKSLLHYGEKELQTGHKAVTLGLGTYILTWAALWILIYTLIPY